jgi:hypothetical protein
VHWAVHVNEGVKAWQVFAQTSPTVQAVPHIPQLMAVSPL